MKSFVEWMRYTRVFTKFILEVNILYPGVHKIFSSNNYIISLRSWNLALRWIHYTMAFMKSLFGEIFYSREYIISWCAQSASLKWIRYTLMFVTSLLVNFLLGVNALHPGVHEVSLWSGYIIPRCSRSLSLRWMHSTLVFMKSFLEVRAL